MGKAVSRRQRLGTAISRGGGNEPTIPMDQWNEIGYPSGTMGWSRHLPELRGRGGHLKRRWAGRGPVLSEVTEQPSPGADGEEEDVPQLRGRSSLTVGPLPIACKSSQLPDGSFPPGQRDSASGLTAPPHSPGPWGRGLARAGPEGGLLSPPGAATPPSHPRRLRPRARHLGSVVSRAPGGGARKGSCPLTSVPVVTIWVCTGSACAADVGLGDCGFIRYSLFPRLGICVAPWR